MCIRGNRSVTSSNDILMSTTNDVVASERIFNIVSVWIYEHFPLFFFFFFSLFFFFAWRLWLGRNSCKFMASQFVIFNPWKVPWKWIAFYQNSFVISHGSLYHLIRGDSGRLASEAFTSNPVVSLKQ